MATEGIKCMESIDPKSLKQRLDAGENLVLLDVREAEELRGELGQLPNIVHIPLGQLPMRVSELPDKTSPVVTICKMGGRAARAGEFLQNAGFKTVLVLDGGMTGWNEAKLPRA